MAGSIHDSLWPKAHLKCYSGKNAHYVGIPTITCMDGWTHLRMLSLM